ncbi:hypothetical protein LQ246_15620, partial [Mycobacterium tuberculosis]|nr:hypothetical protein [Mycobacterium tuberculosis]
FTRTPRPWPWPKVERQHDLLLSTLASYVSAAGAHARIVVTVEGRDLEFDVSTFALVGPQQLPEVEPSQ